MNPGKSIKISVYYSAKNSVHSSVVHSTSTVSYNPVMNSIDKVNEIVWYGVWARIEQVLQARCGSK